MTDLATEMMGLANNVPTTPAEDNPERHLTSRINTMERNMYTAISQLAGSIDRLSAKCITKDDLEEAVGSLSTKINNNSERVTETEKRIQAIEKSQEANLSGFNREIDERLKKQNNIIIFGLQESKSVNSSTRKKTDTDHLNNLLNDIGYGTDVSTAVKTMFRVKKRDTVTDTEETDTILKTKPRPSPLVVVFKNKTLKEHLFKNLIKIKGNPQYKGINIKEDRTKLQQHYDKQQYINLQKRAEEKNKNMDRKEYTNGTRWYVKYNKGQRKLAKAKFDMGTPFANQTMDGTFHGFENTTIQE